MSRRDYDNDRSEQPERPLRAAEYVRMSTDHQKYSTENQSDAIKHYAETRGIEIVCTYADEGKSGLSVDGRDAFKRLIADVVEGRADFEMILVYDVSRWGRFQDTDESAYYECICKRAGVRVQYCAEQFENDGSPIADIIKRMHRALTERGIDRGSGNYVLAGESLDVPVIGRLVERGLDDELKGTAYAVVDGVDGRTHHIRLPHLDAAGDSAPGSIVELRTYEDARGERRVALAVRSDLDLQHQVNASGATWLDRQSIAREPVAMSEGGFGAEVRHAMRQRAEHLVHEGFAEQQGRRVIFSRNLIETLRRREVGAVADRLAKETGQPFKAAGNGEYVAGTYRQRMTLASGRFAMIDDGLGFQLVPWSPSLESQLGKHVSGVARGDGGVDWSFGRKRGLGL
jgi:predicted site-specific integrase-resolvase